jgi:hypothetical protein
VTFPAAHTSTESHTPFDYARAESAAWQQHHSRIQDDMKRRGLRSPAGLHFGCIKVNAIGEDLLKPRTICRGFRLGSKIPFLNF